MEVRDWLNKTTAAEVFVRDVVTLAPKDTLARAATVLLHEQIIDKTFLIATPM